VWPAVALAPLFCCQSLTVRSQARWACSAGSRSALRIASSLTKKKMRRLELATRALRYRGGRDTGCKLHPTEAHRILSMSTCTPR
jgi:hypothetical protein